MSVRYRGRAVPVGWRVIKHKSSSVSLDVYEQLLLRISRLLPRNALVRFMADRGFADTKLMDYLKKSLGWHFRIRVKNDLWILRPGKQATQLKNFHLGLGEAILFQGVKITKVNPFGKVNIALARDSISGELWCIVSDETTSLQTFREYSERFDIEEEFLDEKSNGFQLEKSLIRSPMALSRLCLVMAIATLFLTVQGQEVVKNGKRRFVDCHTFRGNSYLRLGWEWVKGVLYRGWNLFSTLFLCGDVVPEPAVASQRQAKKFLEREFRVRTFSYSS